MARKYRYIDFKTGRVLFETVQPNHMSESEVDKMVLNKTGRDPRLEKATIDREIRIVKD